LNYEGLKRRGFSAQQVQAVKQMHKLLYRDGLSLTQSIEQIHMISQGDDALQALVESMTSFLLSVTPTRGIIR
jgi:UDP-N-acetylglucosamine acyltransferase